MKIFGDFRVLVSNFVKFLMPILKRKVDSSPNFVSLFRFMKDYSSVLFQNLRRTLVQGLCNKVIH